MACSNNAGKIISSYHIAKCAFIQQQQNQKRTSFQTWIKSEVFEWESVFKKKKEKKPFFNATQPYICTAIPYGLTELFPAFVPL